MTLFTPVAKHHLPAIDAQATAWDHPCGLRHIHVHAPDKHLSMLVHVPTSSDGDDGVAHALEHMVMEGSEDYPVDNIISRLSERTMSTFMNAMTSPSATMYPFSSANAQDFTQIAQVYLDCVFNPRLPDEAFASEVTRVALKDGKKVFDGVVFNEMRGVFSDPRRIQYQQQRRWLAPDSALTRNSGGDPLHIVDLTMDRLRQFHSSHYHPSRCTVISYGDIDPVVIQQMIDQRITPALARARHALASPPSPSTAPIHDCVIDIPPSDSIAGHELVLAWPLPAPADRFEQSLYRSYAALLSSSGGPLADCLDSLSPASINQCSYTPVADRHYLVIAASSLSQDQLPQAREIILSSMRATLDDPPPPETIAAILKETQMSILMRSASSDNLGHHLCLSLSTALDDIDDPGAMLRHLDDHALLEQLRAHPIEHGFGRWLSQLVQVAPHQAHVRPDPGFNEALSRQMEDKLQSRPVAPDPRPRATTASALPAATISADLADLPPAVPVQWHDSAVPGLGLCHVRGGVEGVYSVDIVADLSDLEPERIDMIQSALSLANSMGVGDRHWRQCATLRQQDGFSPSVSTDADNRTDGFATITQRVSQTSLEQELQKTCGHMVEMVFNCTYDQARLATILATYQEEIKSQATGRAQSAAQVHALSGFTPAGSINGVLRGLAGDLSGLWLARMAQSSPERLAAEMASALQDYRNAPMAIRVIGHDIPDAIMDMARQVSALRPGCAPYLPGTTAFPQDQRPARDTAFVAPMHVNDCIQAWAAPGLLDRQGPAAGLLAQIISDQYMYGALRDKGGAYGASFSWSDGCFRAASFRDPRLTATFADFDAVIEWIGSGAITPSHLDQARIKQLARVTSPVSLINRAKNAWNREVMGIPAEARSIFIQGLLDARLEDVHAVARQWLTSASPRMRTASMGPQWIGAAEQIGMDVVDVSAMLSPRPSRTPSP